MRKKIICLLGKTCSGKDTIARYIDKRFHIPSIVSYTTRPKRESETDGVEHYFVSKEEFDTLRSQYPTLAYTQFDETGYEYCVLLDENIPDIFVYIIDPKGLDELKHYKDEFDIYSIFVFCDEETIRERSRRRGDKPIDVEARLTGERIMFDSFYNSNAYDYLIMGTDSKEKVFKTVRPIIDSLRTEVSY